MFDFALADGMIFDCDGTLLDTLDAWEDAERDLFAQSGPLTQEQEDEIHSAPIEQAAELFHERYGVGESAAAVLAHLDGHLIPFYRDKSDAMPGAVRFVLRAKELGIPCVVVSSSPKRYLAEGLARAGILECFKALVTTDTVGSSKQEPAIYQAAVDELGCAPDCVWAFVDAPYAIAALHAFGLKTACVGNRSSQFADLNPQSFEELLAD